MFAFLSRPLVPVAAALAVIAGTAFVGSAQAESVKKQCSEKYQAAKAANTLNGETWNQFYKQCAAELKAAAEPATTEPEKTAPPKPTPTAAKPATPAPTEPTTAAAPTPTGPVVFPTAVSPKYASESPGKARMHTCLDQYKANKDTNSNGGLKWIEKGGGYYSECNKKLKGAA
jgi:hypothetical protein